MKHCMLMFSTATLTLCYNSGVYTAGKSKLTLKLVNLLPRNGGTYGALRCLIRCPIGLMDKASASGAEDCRFESCIGRFCNISHLMFQGHMLLSDMTSLY